MWKSPSNHSVEINRHSYHVIRLMIIAVVSLLTYFMCPHINEGPSDLSVYRTGAAFHKTCRWNKMRTYNSFHHPLLQSQLLPPRHFMFLYLRDRKVEIAMMNSTSTFFFVLWGNWQVLFAEVSQRNMLFLRCGYRNQRFDLRSTLDTWIIEMLSFPQSSRKIIFSLK